MKYFVHNENLITDFCFIFEGSIIKVTISGDPVDLALFEKICDTLGFERMEVEHDS